MQPFKPFTETGGARIGWYNASWPFAQLSANEDSLIINVFGRAYTFLPDQVFAIERYRGFISGGIRIRHKVASYPAKIIFWCSSEKVLNGIWDSGFSSSREAANA